MQGASGGQDPFGGDPFMWTPPTNTAARQTAQQPPASGASADADIFDLFGPPPTPNLQQSQPGQLSNGTMPGHASSSAASLDPFAIAFSQGHGKGFPPCKYESFAFVLECQ